jgi:hypothetical protein
MTKHNQAEAVLRQELIVQKHLKTWFLLLQSNMDQDFLEKQRHHSQATTLLYNVNYATLCYN